MAGPVFFLSYARDDDEADDRNESTLVRSFFEKLQSEIRQITGRRRAAAGSFIDVRIPLGALWEDHLHKAVCECQAFVPLMSPSYFQREWCGREWAIFEQRITTANASEWLLPILWYPCTVPPFAAKYLRTIDDNNQAELREALDDYQARGLKWLVKYRDVDPYRVRYGLVVQELARRVAAAASTAALAPFDQGVAKTIAAPFGLPDREIAPEARTPNRSESSDQRGSKPSGNTRRQLAIVCGVIGLGGLLYVMLPNQLKALPDDRFTFICSEINAMPVGATISLTNLEHKIVAYGAELSLSGLDKLSIDRHDTAEPRNKAGEINFRPSTIYPQSAFVSESLHTGVHVIFEKGITLRANACELKKECAQLEFIGHWKASFSTNRLRATLDRYIAPGNITQANENFEIDASSPGPKDPMVVEITNIVKEAGDAGVSSDASLMVSTKARNVILQMSDPVLSKDSQLHIAKCTEIEGHSFKDVNFLSLRPNDSIITVDTSSFMLNIKSIVIECDEKGCHFRILAEGKIVKLEQSGARLWPEEP